LVLFEGEYSGVLEPNRHFVPLKKDFSNFEEVVAKIKDEGLRREIAATAYREVVASGKYSYRSFVERFDEVVEEEWTRRVAQEASGVRPEPRRRPPTSAALRFLWLIGETAWITVSSPTRDGSEATFTPSVARPLPSGATAKRLKGRKLTGDVISKEIDLDEMIEKFKERKRVNEPDDIEARVYLVEQLKSRGMKMSEIATKLNTTRQHLYNFTKKAAPFL